VRPPKSKVIAAQLSIGRHYLSLLTELIINFPAESIKIVLLWSLPRP
jgi:hypothetical protein